MTTICRHCAIRERQPGVPGPWLAPAAEGAGPGAARPVLCAACGRILDATDLIIHDKLRQLARFGFGPGERPLLAAREIAAERRAVPHGERDGW